LLVLRYFILLSQRKVASSSSIFSLLSFKLLSFPLSFFISVSIRTLSVFPSFTLCHLFSPRLYSSVLLSVFPYFPLCHLFSPRLFLTSFFLHFCLLFPLLPFSPCYIFNRRNVCFYSESQITQKANCTFILRPTKSSVCF
jgi:hypothetical protein